MSSRVTLVLCGLALICACPQPLPSAEQLRFGCARDGDCPSGQVCTGHGCQEPPRQGDDRTPVSPDSPRLDATSQDLEATTDGGAADAVVLDDGSAESGLHDRPSEDLGIEDAVGSDSRRDSAQPDSSRPDTVQADIGWQDGSGPDTAEPDTGRHDAAGPDAAEPDASALDADALDAEEPDSGLVVTCQLQSGNWSFSAPEPLSGINTGFVERDPVLSTDGLTLYFASDRPGGQGGWDIYRASRADRDQPFGDTTPMTSLNSASDDARVSFTHDELLVIVASWRSGGPGQSDFWFATRGSIQEPFGALTPLPVVSTADSEYDPTVSPDGLHLYYAPANPSGGLGGQDVMLASRTSRHQDFSPPVNLQTVNSAQGDADPSFTFDERILLFSSDRPGTLGGTDLWYSSRASTADAFGAPQHLPGVNSTAQEGDPFLSGDGCELFFYSNRPGGAGGADIWVARYRPGG